ncbi:hypothetical protein EJ08DRAFT_647002 [Tothia fuscella]|uniref:Uncharacterized protein n=1 Tax=Tothia fuscella TaxID=1048955 RepID=A0A9P4NWL7_9PEZI|nr:hypothetical protein EJ08DRAFT_647002 [Tothia fuscella]
MKVCAVTGRVVPPDLDLATGQFAMVRDYLEDYMMGKERYVDMFAKLIAICSHFGLGYVAMA